MKKVYLTSCVRFKQLPSDFSSVQGCTASPIFGCKGTEYFCNHKIIHLKLTIMRKEMLLVHIFVKFGYNYPNPEEFINYICEKTGKNYLKEHLRGKFNQIYDDYGSHAVMNYFFIELDLDLQEALVDYALNVYAPVGMKTKYNEYESL